MIAVLGDILVDILAKTDGELALASDTPAHVVMSPGGSAAGTAAWLAHDGYSVCLLSAVGTDTLADLAVASMTGVTLRIQRRTDVATGCCVVIIGVDGERTMLPDAGANLTWAWRPSDLDGVTHLHVSGYTAYRDETHEDAFAAMSAARARGISVSLDLASSAPIRQHRNRAIHALGLSDLVFGNVDEAAALWADQDDHDLLESLLDHVTTAVIKRGSRGCLAGSGVQRVQASALAAVVVDSTGAGDAFSAGFLPAWLSHADLAHCVAQGQSSAIRTLGRVGAGPPVGEPPQ
jgi:sugar/nucleoside kinase (ribokinase family)